MRRPIKQSSTEPERNSSGPRDHPPNNRNTRPHTNKQTSSSTAPPRGPQNKAPVDPATVQKVAFQVLWLFLQNLIEDFEHDCYSENDADDFDNEYRLPGHLPSGMLRRLMADRATNLRRFGGVPPFRRGGRGRGAIVVVGGTRDGGAIFLRDDGYDSDDSDAELYLDHDRDFFFDSDSDRYDRDSDDYGSDSDMMGALYDSDDDNSDDNDDSFDHDDDDDDFDDDDHFIVDDDSFDDEDSASRSTFFSDDSDSSTDQEEDTDEAIDALLCPFENGYMSSDQLTIGLQELLRAISQNARKAKDAFPKPAHKTYQRLLSLKGANILKKILRTYVSELPSDIGSESWLRAVHHRGSNVTAVKLYVDLVSLGLKMGTTDIIDVLYEVDPNPDFRDDKECTPLMWAAYTGEAAVVEALLRKPTHAGVNDRNEAGLTALILASKRGYSEIGKMLLNSGASVNATGIYGHTPLLTAIDAHEDEIARVLIAAKADVNQPDRHGEPPIMLAARCDCDLFVQLLVDARADVDKANRRGKTVLMDSAKEGRVKRVELLLEAGADVNMRSEKRGTALNYGVMGESVGVVRHLLGAKADLEVQTMSGDTPLMQAVVIQKKELVQLLVDANADVNTNDEYGRAPLHVAGEPEDFDIVRVLLRAKADVTRENNEGYTPLMVHVYAISAPMTPVYVLAGALGAATESTRARVLMRAVMGGEEVVVRALVNAGVEVDVVGDDGDSAVMCAVKGGHAGILQLLIDAHADINSRNAAGQSPLMYAIEADDRHMAKILAAADADVFCLPSGKNVLNYLRKNKKFPMMNAIKNAQKRVMRRRTREAAEEAEGRDSSDFEMGHYRHEDAYERGEGMGVEAYTTAIRYLFSASGMEF